jgi:hypothetical protein
LGKNLGFQLVTRGAACLRKHRLRDRQLFAGYLRDICAFSLFESLALFRLSRDGLLGLRRDVAVLRQGFSRQNLKPLSSRLILPRDELALHVAMLAELSSPMPHAAAARLEAIVLMRFARGCGWDWGWGHGGNDRRIRGG